MHIHGPKHCAVHYKYIQLLSVGRLQKQKNVYMNTKNHKKGPLHDIYISFQKDIVDMIQNIEEIFCVYLIVIYLCVMLRIKKKEPRNLKGVWKGLKEGNEIGAKI